MNKIKTIVNKEWAEVFKNRIVLFTVAFLPLIFLALPIITLVAMNSFEADMSSMNTGEMAAFVGELCNDLDEMACTEVYMLNLYTLMFMMLPVIVPVTIAAYSIVGEKTSRSLEPLLATPITTTELLLGKMFAACIPAIAVTWAAFAIYAVAMWFMVSEVVFKLVMAPMWLVAIFVVGPLMSLMAVSAAVLISSRVTDPRAAEQLSAFVILPIILLIIGQSMGLILIDARMILLLGLVVLVLDVVLVTMSVKLFQRETILTQWK
ncbi:MAG: ABC transporter permease subunit [Anaerolineae bacterium]|nr:ABC transporter permease subunit [Anaerolineae bacterium]